MEDKEVKLLRVLAGEGLIPLASELEEFLDSDTADLSEYCHERADGDSDVIYYGAAGKLFSKASSQERAEAEDAVNDCGGFGNDKTMADRFCILAYWIVYNRLTETIREQAEEVSEALDEVIDTLSDIKMELDDI